MRALHRDGLVIVVGSGGHLLSGALPDAAHEDLAAPDPVVVARLAARSGPPAHPLYLRAPDAKLPSA